MVFSVFTGNEALSVMTRDDFRQEWTALYEACPWATSAQSPSFTSLRCALYRDRSTPVLAVQREAGTLVGLLALAVQDGEQWTLGASCDDGEYHVWLAEPANAESFMPLALEALSETVDMPPISLRYVPGDVALEWTKQGRFRLLAELRPAQTPVLSLGVREDAIKFVQSKDRLRSKRSGLARLGKVTFRRVIGTEGFERVLDRFEAMSIGRSAQKTGSLTQKCPIKRAFLAARQAVPGLQHTTVLELDENPIAMHIGIEGRPGGAFSLAGITHDITYSKYSPGSLLLAELIPLLCDEGYSLFDLTPGDDAYKERWSERSETVYELRLYPSLASRGFELASRPGPSALRKLRNLTAQARQTASTMRKAQ